MRTIGIAGFGFMGRFHLSAYRKAGQGQVAAVFDVNPNAFAAASTAGNIGTAAAELADVKLLSDYDAFLASVDVVDICTPTPFHLDLVMRAFKAGKHVLLEKPMALAIADCNAMIAAARSAGVTFMVAHCVRFWPGYDVLIDAARDGRFGRLLTAAFQRISGSAFWSPWFLAEDKSGSAVIDMLVHDFDLCRLLGGMPEQVDALGSYDRLGKGTGVNYVHALVRGAAGGPAFSVAGGWIPSGKFPFNMSYLAQFEDATLSFDCGREKPLVVYPSKGEPYMPELAPHDGYEAEVRYFLSVLGGAPSSCMPEESRDAVAIGLAARESVLKGAPVRVKL
jgi:predicted dehydrogenase